MAQHFVNERRHRPRSILVPPPRLRAQPPEPTRWAGSISEFVDDYDLWLVDQWGVLHDGIRPFPGVVDALQNLKGLGKRVIVLSNSGKRVEANIARLTEMGISASCYSALLTSGELARTKLSGRAPPFDKFTGRRCLLLTSDPGSTLLDGVDVEQATSISEADFILITGIDDRFRSSDYQAIFELGCARKLPLICANPDLVRVTARGMLPGVGEFARLYEELGGTVHYIGKPYLDIYLACLQQDGLLQAGRAIAIGDSMYHDIIGGSRAGLATAFVTGGIHAPEFVGTRSDAERLDRARELARDYGVAPDWTIPAFRWCCPR
jgi:HAD superfamily hydrolase (TIGR01459 family)